MTTDTELETWRREWRDQTEPLPELKRKIRRQNLRTAGAVAAMSICLALSTVEAVRSRSAFIAGLAVGLAVVSLVLGGYSWWLLRGAWKPTAQTTLAYAQLSYKRAVAKSRTLRFSFYFLLVATVLFTALVAWHWKQVRMRDGLIIVAMAIEAFFLRHYRQRKQREIEETKKLIDDMTE